VFWKVAKAIIQGSQRLDILIDCNQILYKVQSSPSWAPNWQYYHQFSRTLHSNAEGWEASRALPAIVSFEDDDKSLKTRGFIIGKLFREFNEFQPSKPNLAAMSLRQWLNFAGFALDFFSPLSVSRPSFADSTTALYEGIVQAVLPRECRRLCSHNQRRLCSDTAQVCSGLLTLLMHLIRNRQLLTRGLKGPFAQPRVRILSPYPQIVIPVCLTQNTKIPTCRDVFCIVLQLVLRPLCLELRNLYGAGPLFLSHLSSPIFSLIFSPLSPLPPTTALLSLDPKRSNREVTKLVVLMPSAVTYLPKYSSRYGTNLRSIW
jgi:hypothetical protein